MHRFCAVLTQILKRSVVSQRSELSHMPECDRRNHHSSWVHAQILRRLYTTGIFLFSCLLWLRIKYVCSCVYFCLYVCVLAWVYAQSVYGRCMFSFLYAQVAHEYVYSRVHLRVFVLACVPACHMRTVLAKLYSTRKYLLVYVAVADENGRVSMCLTWTLWVPYACMHTYIYTHAKLCIHTRTDTNIYMVCSPRAFALQ